MSLHRPIPEDPYRKLPAVSSFDLASKDIAQDRDLAVEHIYSGDGLHGGNLSPHLVWSGFPSQTQSFVVSCFDPDAPTPSGFWHWVVVDLPADTASLDQGAGSNDAGLPAGAFHLRNDMSSPNYAGASPPPGDFPHRYFFVVHAVDIPTLGLDSSATPAAAAFNLAFHTLARAIIVPVFSH
ncbi:YbhB/YbcL family Raf kinase inhibitor-like protein [Nakamurella antarctica]|uniref:YbhB/YbcL family Raf kinase inhibitor-like protein n=1 Tax=Nakamurella antarctica TaxID=1902245 RepID=A0A3G8ZLS7_9ACTN|nr:YbhB/YbcL family Raf kinase inhibitor-like protein [Nakamurella antarctica]AZI58108.1 YbhB/YbcL family Raf kinase inhibitor-like protein [Nakamurella antarctica]